MRNAFAKELVECAARDERVILLAGDIGNRLFDTFQARFPGRFFNCGVAEANMMSVAAGLALGGLRPVVYTIAPFVTYRCYEQIKIDVCYNSAPVVIVGVGGGLGYAGLGPTHHSLEDVAALRVLPDMSVVCPADAHEVRGALRDALAIPRPVYLRIGKKGEPVVHASEPEFTIGTAMTLRPGDDVTLISTGTVLPDVMVAADRLKEQGVAAGVVNFHTIKPLDTATLRRLATSAPLLVTVEEHSLIGGLGSAVAEWMADEGVGCRLVRMGTPDAFFHEAGETEHARHRLGLDAAAIVARVTSALKPR
ncbi:MAG: transketolase C-terminal domain-containing protein [Deltaproteobacteria bacterium]|nr:transketolase C-terminal domain-containing protein [Deltaproteobacteria bacterium]